MKNAIKVSSLVKAPAEITWLIWTTPDHILHWNHASDDWHTPRAENNLHLKGRFSYRMESKDGKMGFDFCGTYTGIHPYKTIEYTLDDGIKVSVQFAEHGGKTLVTEKFEPENQNPDELQKEGWQAILKNFKKYTENLLLNNHESA
jgi:uncharacterized protein YndB with AHSA1/START domain